LNKLSFGDGAVVMTNTLRPDSFAGIFWLKLTVLFLANLLLLLNARATLLFYDGFNYPPGETLGKLSSSPAWENPKRNLTIISGNLAYPGLRDSTGNSVRVLNGSSNLDGPRTLAWTAQSSGTLYFSFLLKLNAANGITGTEDGIPIVNVSSAVSAAKQLISINLINRSGIHVGVVKYDSRKMPVSSAFFSSGPGADLSANGSTTYLIVGKYEWTDGANNDTATVWVNPDNLGTGESAANKVSVSLGADGSRDAGRFYIDRGPRFVIDELRIATTWAEVTPSSGPLAAQ
jgi:hypothetical protein